jgi:fibronectin-binding autotransporter adhesin
MHLSDRLTRRFRRFATVAVFLAAAGNSPAVAQTVWQVATGSSSWSTAANWNPATVPNAVGANATFNGNATANNPAQTGNRTATLDGTKTVGSIVFNTDLSTFTNSITTGTGGPLVFDNGGAGASITTMGGGSGNNTVSVGMTLNDSLTAFVNNTAATSAAGSLNLTGTMSGAGGFTKLGDGMATFGTGARSYTGPTVLGDSTGAQGGGRMRISQAAQPANTSSFTINAGAQLDLISAGTYTFGPGPLNLSGSGPTTGPFAAFPGAIRPDRPASGSLDYTITNNTVLQSDTLIHVEARAGTGSSATPSDSITFSGVVSGPGKLTITAPNSDVDQGTLNLTNANTYSGGTLVQGGIVQASATGAFGTGNVTVDNTLSPNSIARINIAAGVTNAISDAAVLSLLGGGAAGVADQNFANLGAGVNETVGGLVLGGVSQAPGTYGSSTSGATFQNDEYFSGPGTINVVGVPEPGTMALAGMAHLEKDRPTA